MARWMWHWSGRCAIRIFAGGSNRYEGPGRVEQDCGSAGAEVVSPDALAPATELDVILIENLDLMKMTREFRAYSRLG
jgi:hypothetical protein